MTNAPPAAGSGITVATIRRMIDNFDDEIDNLRDYPFIGNFAKPFADVMDVVRKAVDSDVPEEIRDTLDRIDDEVKTLSRLPLIGGYVTSISGVIDRLRIYVDAADPKSPVAAPPAKK